MISGDGPEARITVYMHWNLIVIETKGEPKYVFVPVSDMSISIFDMWSREIQLKYFYLNLCKLWFSIGAIFHKTIILRNFSKIQAFY